MMLDCHSYQRQCHGPVGRFTLNREIRVLTFSRRELCCMTVETTFPTIVCSIHNSQNTRKKNSEGFGWEVETAIRICPSLSNSRFAWEEITSNPIVNRHQILSKMIENLGKSFFIKHFICIFMQKCLDFYETTIFTTYLSDALFYHIQNWSGRPWCLSCPTPPASRAVHAHNWATD